MFRSLRLVGWSFVFVAATFWCVFNAHGATFSSMLSASGIQSIVKANVQVNGVLPTRPIFVEPGDKVKFDIFVGGGSTNAAQATGLGLCLQYAASVMGNPRIANESWDALIGTGQSLWLQGCNRGGFVFNADAQVIHAWVRYIGVGWPVGLLPFKLYDAEFTVASHPVGSTQIGFASSSVPPGYQFVPDPTLVLCGKPRVSAVRIADGSPAAKFRVELSVPVPAHCGVGGQFPVRAELAGTSVRPGQRNVDFTVTGDGVEIDGDGLKINFLANGQQSQAIVSVRPVSGTVPQNGDALRMQFLAGTGNYRFDPAETREAIAAVSMATHTLQVSTNGKGSGTVTSNVPGIVCGIDCSHAFLDGSVVSLAATPATGSTFVGWLGACTGRGACYIAMTDATAVSATFGSEATKLGLDVDGNTSVDAITDALLLMRSMFGLTGSALANGAVGSGAARSTPQQLLDRLGEIYPLLDIDGNGKVEALTDGLMLFRYFNGLRGAALIVGAVGSGAIRTTSAQIEAYIQNGMH